MFKVANGKMFTFRFNSYRIFQYLLILIFVSSEVIAGQTPKKCAAFNEYCQNHWDCCSNSCMSYLYRCTRGYNVYPYPFLGVSFKPSVTLDQILEQNFGSSNYIPVTQPKPYFASRFGVPDDAGTTEVEIVLQTKSDETNQESSTLKNPVIMEQSTTFKNPVVLQQESTTLRNPVVLQENTAVFENRLGEEVTETQKKTTDDVQTTQTTLDTSTTEKPSCSEIGVKCYTNDECCTKRCHGFLHQCVT
ncbi:uncharacterized protein LOC111676058 [Lucilia cuprina]|uniref:uncharacterized protein LOC111676058 n=1 Tax=Lucilia cuprina TaxID=7375 RepID=UPI001F06225E|nr:uncharacterized protein LOC111676058 [Lucilia cuprina]